MKQHLQAALQSLVATEHRARQRQLHQHLRKAPVERIRSGTSIILRISPSEIESVDGDIYLTGTTPYQEHARITDASIGRNVRCKGQHGTSSGDFMTLTPLDPDSLSPLDPAKRQPRRITQSPLVTLNTVTTSPQGPLRVRATILNVDWRGPCLQSHKSVTLDPDADGDDLLLPPAGATTGCGSEESWCAILDPAVDDVSLNRATYILGDIDQSPLFQTLANLWDGSTVAPTVPRPNPPALRAFVDHLQANVGPETFPNHKQKSAIFADDATATTDPKVLLCQGIPGAGKTSGYLAPAILGRLYAACEADQRPRVLVTAPSNTAIDRVVESLASLYETCQGTHLGESLDALRIVRAAHTRPAMATVPPAVADHVEFVAPTSEYVESLRDDCLVDATETDPIIVAATPTSLYSLLGSLYQSYSAGYLLRDNRTYFDLFAVDEASMLTVPQLLVAGAHVATTAPLLVAGDHRQLGPIWAHSWADDPRPRIQQTVPFLSAMDYFRLLGGETVDGVDQDALTAAPTTNIPKHVLTTSYRLSETVGSLVERSVYRDDLNEIETPTSSQSSPTSAATDALAQLTEPTADLVVLLHDEETSRRSNPTEAAIVAALTATITDDVRVLSPYNAQRGVITAVLANDDGELPAHVRDVTTVNRAQGREHDITIMSASASLPAYLRQQERFLWNPDRLNVLCTRADQTLIIIASRSAFEIMPMSDTETFSDARLWWELATMVGLDATPDWGPVPLKAIHPAIATHSGVDNDTSVEIYTT